MIDVCYDDKERFFWVTSQNDKVLARKPVIPIPQERERNLSFDRTRSILYLSQMRRRS